MMDEHPPGYEAEEPVDLAKTVSVYSAESRPEPEPLRATVETPQRLRRTRRRIPAELLVEVSGSCLTVIANVKPGTFKTTTARMLESVLGPIRDDFRFVEGAQRPTRGLVVADSPSDPRGISWRSWIHFADQLVIPVPAEVEAANAAKWMLDELESEGLFALTTSAITVVIRTGHDRRLARRLTTYFGGRTAEVVQVRPREGDPSRWVPLAGRLLRRLAARSVRTTRAPEVGQGRVVPLHLHKRKAVS